MCVAYRWCMPVLTLGHINTDRGWFGVRTSLSNDKEYNGRHVNQNHPVYYHYLCQSDCCRVDV